MEGPDEQADELMYDHVVHSNLLSLSPWPYLLTQLTRRLLN